MKRIPAQGMPSAALFDTLDEFRAHDVDWRSGRTWAYVYDPGSEAETVIKQAYASFLSENALDPTAFPSTLRLENELVAMATAHLNGDADVVGNFTSGGTESILLAVKAARDWARETRPHITAPEMVLPITAHAAFQKAGHYLSVTPVLVPVDPVTFKADPDAVRRAITPNTILLVASAVSYAHGVVDPVRALAGLAHEQGLWLHVDGCIGGFLLPYFRRLGAEVPDFDFTVPGVTSISMDFHKYAFAAKGASVVLYRNRALRRHQIYACSTWTGYTVINPTIQSTKSGGPLAAAWAALHFLGDEGYLTLARSALEATRRIVAGIAAIPELRVLGRPEMNLVAFTSDTVGVFHIIDEMKACGWYVQPQLAFGPSQENIHLSVNPASARWVDDFLADLRACVDAAKGQPSGQLAAMVQQALGAMDINEVGEETLSQALSLAGIEGTAVPARMAGINEMLNALPPQLRERLLIAYLNQLMQYREP